MSVLQRSISENEEPSTPSNQKIQLKKKNTPSVLNSAKKKLGSIFSSNDQVWHPISRPSNVTRQCFLSEDLEWSGNAFVMGKQIGSGSFATVFLGTHVGTGAQFAIKKVPLPHGQHYKRQKESLEREIQVLKDCRSPYIVSYFGSFTKDDTDMCIVMEFLPGGTLQDVIKEYDRYGGLDETHMRTIVGSVLKGLAYLHERNIMHRDLKSKNILIDADGGTKLADFGVSRELNQSGMARSMVGTPLFMAPEVLEGESYSAVADVWSLGIVALHVANGEIPRRGTPVRDLMRMVVSQPPPKISSPTQWSAEFSQFVSMCLVKDPSRRATCAELLACSWIRNTGEDSEQTKATMVVRTVGRASTFKFGEESPRKATPCKIDDRTPSKVLQKQMKDSVPQKQLKESTPLKQPPAVSKQVETPSKQKAEVEPSTPSKYEDLKMEEVVKELLGWKQLALKLLDEREGKVEN